MGVLVVRHLKRVERVVTGYLEVCDGPEEQSRIAILDALEKTITVAWSRSEVTARHTHTGVSGQRFHFLLWPFCQHIIILCRMACRLSVLVRSLLRLLVDVSSEDTSAAVRQELMDRARAACYCWTTLPREKYRCVKYLFQLRSNVEISQQTWWLCSVVPDSSTGCGQWLCQCSCALLPSQRHQHCWMRATITPSPTPELSDNVLDQDMLYCVYKRPILP